MHSEMEDSKKPIATVIKRLLVSSAMGFIFSMAIMLLAAALFASGALPQGAVPTAAVIACAAGGFTAGLRMAKKQRNYTLWMGLLAGLTLFVFFYLLGAILFVRLTPAQNSLPILLASFGGGVGGGVLSGLVKTKNKR